MMIIKFIKRNFLIQSFFVLVTLATSIAHAQHDLPINIGALASLTGPAAEQGRNWLDGAELAVDQLQAERIPVKLFVEDDATNATKANSAFTKLVTSNKVQAVVGGTWDFTAEAVFPLAAKFHIPFVTPSNPVEVFSASAKANPYVFTNGLSISASKKAIKEFLQAKHPRTLAIVVPQVPFGIFHADMLEELAKTLGITVLLRKDLELVGYQGLLRIIAVKLKRDKPDLVFCIAGYEALDLFVSEMEKVHFQPTVLTVQHLDQAIAFSGNPKRYENVFGVYPRPPSLHFVEIFKQKYSRPPKVFSAEGYDALMFLALAIKQRVDFREPFFTYSGVTGQHHIKGDSRNLVESEAVIMHTSPSGILEKENFYAFDSHYK